MQAPRWAWLLMVAAVSLAAVAGTWQLQRGQSKARWQEELLARDATPLLLKAGVQAQQGRYRYATATGRFDADRQLLNEGQSHAGKAGEHVWTPLLLDSGAVLAVNRGWIPIAATRTLPQQLAATQGVVTVSGWWRSLPEPGLRVNTGGCPSAPQFPLRVLYPDLAQLECLWSLPVLPGILLMAPELPAGYVREWDAGGLPPERHYGYAVQWYALGLTALILFFWINRGKRA